MKLLYAALLWRHAAVSRLVHLVMALVPFCVLGVHSVP